MDILPSLFLDLVAAQALDLPYATVLWRLQPPVCDTGFRLIAENCQGPQGLMKIVMYLYAGMIAPS